ncbi:MAG: hypothetical protein MI725_02220 [Pirellulales bacterium]|nr:hypothetical protein [Pirellulales bacterium]
MSNSRTKYNDAVQRTAEEAMLLNLVRLRYRESPEFVAVKGITTQYRFDTTARVGGEIIEFTGNTLDMFGEVQHRERPTISYTPQQDEEFNSRLMAPINLETIVLLTRSSWATERMLRLCVHNINGLDNASEAGGPTPDVPPDFEEFKYLSQVIHRLKLRRAIDIATETRLIPLSDSVEIDNVRGEALVSAVDNGYELRHENDGKNMVLLGKQRQAVLRIHPWAMGSDELADVYRLLRLRPHLAVYDMTLATEHEVKPRMERREIELLPPPADVDQNAPNSRQQLETELDIATRSVLEIMYYLSHAVQVPNKDMKCGLVTVTTDHDGNVFDWSRLTGDLLRISVAQRRPKNTAVAVHYRGHWFYIEDRDLQSKATFTLLSQLYNLEIRGGGGANLPILALGIGGDD